MCVCGGEQRVKTLKLNYIGKRPKGENGQLDAKLSVKGEYFIDLYES